ncbi:C-type natriuretic peptide-like [Narcine bancroftii]|uniref:C-type natriuretic peptide-like n=1 Tax=Narcine bancroftii TaxID=1343680 RepID=UPI003831315D
MGACTASYCGLALVLLIHVEARPNPQQSIEILTKRLEEVEPFLTNEKGANEADETSPTDNSFDLPNAQSELERISNLQELEGSHTVSDDSLLRLLQDITNGPLRSITRSRKRSTGGCFGMKLDRIGAMSGLGC